jgi:23S rRNA (uracil1939-C5)-methyltransferase
MADGRGQRDRRWSICSASGKVMTPMPKPNRPALPPRIDTPVTIERIVPGGYGLARVLGRVVLVFGAAPGDIVHLELERAPGTTLFARITEIVVPSSDRIPPPFPDATRCGGADFQHLTYDAQLRAKSSIITDALRRTGGIELADPIPMTPSPEIWGYRARADWRYDPAPPALGYLAHGTRQVCDLPFDPFVTTDLATLYDDLRGHMQRGDLPHVGEFKAAASLNDVSLAPPLEGGEVRPIAIEVAGERLWFDATVFFQANPGILPDLVAEALRFAPAADDYAAQPPDVVAVDLYAGVGLFTLPLARRYRRVVAVEADAPTAAYLTRNASEAELRGIRVVAEPVERWLDGAYRTYGRPALALLDPPRTGLPSQAASLLARLRPVRIAYVSCDPPTLARDLKRLIGSGYRLEQVIGFDMFPQTHHVEAVAHLVREEQQP